VTLADVRSLARKRPEQEFFINRLYGAHVSPFFTVLCLRAGLSPDQVTLVGASVGALGILLLVLPFAWSALVAVALLQVGYILDFSDGQVARITGRSSVAGSYLDWLTHFYVPVAMVLAVGLNLVWTFGWLGYFALASAAALELAGFAFSCREHVLIAMQRTDPALGGTAAFHAALMDDARPTDVEAATAGPAVTAEERGISGRIHHRGVRAVIGELLVYPGAVHLVTVATVVDVVVASLFAPVPAVRPLLLVLWTLAFPIHLAMAVRRNHRLIQAVEVRARQRA
jgi:phosphatidylglycerophosphate synthase